MEETTHAQRFYRQNRDRRLKESLAYNQTPKGKYSALKRNCKYKGKRSVDITFEEFMTFWQKECYYCGLDVETIGLDRFNNKLGYTMGNIVSCCHICNYMKHTQSVKNFIERCHLIAERYPNPYQEPMDMDVD